MATKKNTKVNDSVSDEKIKSVSDDSVDNSINDSAATAVDDDVDVKKVEDNDTSVEQVSDAVCDFVRRHKPPTIRVKRVENKDLEATLQEVGYRNVAQILVEPSLGFALFNIIYWESNDEDED